MLGVTKQSNWLFWGIFALVAGCFAFILIVFPRAYDDWWYWGEWAHYGADENGHHTLLMGWRESLSYHWQTDNMRLANLVCAPLLQMHRWVAGAVCAVCFALGLWLMTRVAGIKPGEIAKLVMLCLLLVFPSIWQEAMFTKVFAFNYICVLPIMFGAILIFVREKPIKPIWAFLMGLLLGCWQEGYALPVLGGGILVLIIHRHMIDRRRAALLAGTASGLALLLMPPALWTRFGDAHPHFQWVRMAYLALAFVYIGVWIVSLCRNDWRRIALSPLGLITIAGCVGLMLLVVHTNLIRAAFASLVLSACALTVFFSKFWPRLFNDKNLASKIFSVAGTLLLGIHLVAVCDETVKLRPVIDNINDRYLWIQKPDTVFFAPTRYVWDSSPLTLGRPDIDMGYPGGLHSKFMRYVSHSFDTYFIPAELENYAGQGEPLPGGTSCRLWKGHIVSPEISDINNAFVKTVYNNGVSAISPSMFIPFRGADGREYVYVLPNRPVQAIYAGAPKAITYLPGLY